MVSVKKTLSKVFHKLSGFSIEHCGLLVIELTSDCNCACPVCAPAHVRNQIKRGYMSREIFDKIVVEAGDLNPRQVCLYARGESLLHKGAVDMTRVLSDAGFYTELVTNGELINPEISKDLYDAGLSKLVISYPGISSKNYRMARGKNEPQGLADNIVKSIEQWSCGDREVSLRSLIFHKTKSEIDDWVINLVDDRLPDFLDKWLSVEGLSSVEIHGYMPWPRFYDETYLSHLTTYRRRCEHALNAMVVYWNGDVTPCSYDVHSELCIGSINNETLSSLYNNSKMRQFRKRMYSHKISKLDDVCRNCLIPRYPVPLKLYTPDRKEESIREIREIIAQRG
ncbi:MAG TPA: SPASM domain-containing protein [Spirochaetota bacterium]|nr:SPASM domain-containing protein [Spirochaetota bacterium]